MSGLANTQDSRISRYQAQAFHARSAGLILHRGYKADRRRLSWTQLDVSAVPRLRAALRPSASVVADTTTRPSLSESRQLCNPPHPASRYVGLSRRFLPPVFPETHQNSCGRSLRLMRARPT